jgi:beta-N-acetylhexosaminidase
MKSALSSAFSLLLCRIKPLGRMKYKKSILVFLLCIAGTFVAKAQKSYIQSLQDQNQWVDSVFNKMKGRQRIAQMFFVRALTNAGKAYEDSIGNVVKKEKIGGLVFFQGGPGRQLNLTNSYQKLARVPLLIALDGEWGLGMRLDSTVSYPYQMALGAVQDTALIYKMGLEVARDFKRIGMQMNFAPDVDINNNPLNPVINYRSFGENKYNVVRKAAAYMKGMQDGGLLVTLKHFPGHGDTDVDSHQDLPQINFTRARLDSLEMYPFRELIAQGASGIMVAHLHIPSLDNTPNLPSTLSRPIITNILKGQLGFKGLVVSDALEMKGVVKFFKEGEADVMAVEAGNDILELSENSARGIKLVRKAVRSGRISRGQIDSSVKKILLAKYYAGLNNPQAANPNNIAAEINRPESIALVQELANASMTALKGKQFLKTLSAEKRTAIISIGTPTTTTFQREINAHYTNAVVFNLDKTATAAAVASVMADIGNYEQVIIGIHDTRTRPGNGMVLSADLKQFIKQMSAANAVFALFANPYNLSALEGLENSKALIVAYQKEDFMQKAAASVINNQIIPNGKLPVSVNTFFKYGDGE